MRAKTLCLGCIGIIGLLGSCRVPTRNKQASETIMPATTAIVAKELTAGYGAVAQKEIKDIAAQFAKVMKFPYQTKMSLLPRSGRSKFVPYSGYYYYNKNGGANSSGALTRYDQAFGTKAAEWERANHTIPASDPDAAWHGHCNGWAAAASRLAEPPTAVVRNGVTFSRGDLKALLAEIHMSLNTISLGGEICEADGTNSKPGSRDSDERTNMGSCEDVNPGSFITAVANMLGGLDPLPLMFDEARGRQVWNFPMFEYKCLNCSNDRWLEVDSRTAQNIISGNGSTVSVEYPFNPDAKRWYDVRLSITYAEGSMTQEIVGTPLAKSKVYRFIVEANEEDTIVGGEWALESQNDHPDVLRLPLDPVRGSGDKKSSNPQLDPAVVMEMWRDSWRQAGTPLPYEGKRYPIWEDQWGDGAEYTIAINGSKSGSVYMGKLHMLQIELKSSWLLESHFDARLNDVPVHEQSVTKMSFDFPLKLKPGINKLSLHWRKSHVNEKRDYIIQVLP